MPFKIAPLVSNGVAGTQEGSCSLTSSGTFPEAYATYVDVFTGKLRKGDIAIVGEKIVGTGEYEGIEEIDCTALTVLPSYIDGHLT